MYVFLTPYMEAYVKQKVEKGINISVSEVIREALPY